MIRKLHANPHQRPGTWGKSDCADALLQVASTVKELSEQLERLWRLADRDMRSRLDAAIAPAFADIDTRLAIAIEGCAHTIQGEADREAA